MLGHGESKNRQELISRPAGTYVLFSAVPLFRNTVLFSYSLWYYVFVLCSRNMYNTKVLTVLISYYTIVQIILDTIIVKCRAECTTVSRLKSPIIFSLAVWLRQIQLDFRIFSGDVILYSLLTISPGTIEM